MTAEFLTGAAGVILSLLFSYFPGLSDWYAKLDSAKKSLLMLGIILAIAAAIFAGNCYGVFTSYIPKISCDQAGVEKLLVLIFLTAVANQTTYMLSPQKARKT